MFNKKLFMSLGTLTAITAPVTAVISCGVNLQPTEDELKLKNQLDSLDFQKKTENLWQYQVLGIKEGEGLNKEYKFANDFVLTNEVAIIAKSIIAKKVFEDKGYLNKLAQSLLDKNEKRYFKAETDEEDAYTRTWLDKNGLISQSTYGMVSFGLNGVTDDALKVLLTTNDTSFKTEVLKALIAQKYLGEVKYAQWKIAFPEEDENRSYIEEKIKEDNYALVDRMMKRKYFAKWELSPKNELNGNQLVTKGNFAESLAAMKDGGAFAKLAKYEDDPSRKKISEFIFDFAKYEKDAPSAIAKDGKNIYGFAGIESAPTGKGILDYSFSSYEKANELDNWFGFLTPDKFIDMIGTKNDDPTQPNKHEKFKWKEDGKLAKLTLLKGIMPIYKEFKLDVALGTKDEIVRFFATNDSTSYTQAMKFYLTDTSGENEVNNAIVLEVENKQVKDYLEQKGEAFTFIKERVFDNN